MYSVKYDIVATPWVLAATYLGWCSKRGWLEDEWAEIRWGNVIDGPPPKKVGPQRFSKIAGGELPLLMRGRGVSTTAMIGKRQYLVAALIPSEAGTVWLETPTIKAVAEKAAEMQRKHSAKSNPPWTLPSRRSAWFGFGGPHGRARGGMFTSACRVFPTPISRNRRKTPC